MSSRHEKWQPVEPGHVIPAGQPYRIEYCTGERPQSIETQADTDRIANKHDEHSDARHEWFIDSSWRPPLELPTEPTWGIAVTDDGEYVGKWSMERPEGWSPDSSTTALYIDGKGKTLYAGTDDWINTSAITDFIECTPEQVARIEGHL